VRLGNNHKAVNNHEITMTLGKPKVMMLEKLRTGEFRKLYQKRPFYTTNVQPKVFCF